MASTFITRRPFLLLLIIPTLLCGCQKVYDYIHIPEKGHADNKSCIIQKVTAQWDIDPAGGTAHFTFSYNKQGNPLTVINDNPGTGNPNLLFRYDKYNRLVQFIRPYDISAAGFETWNKYGYNSKNQIVRDTQYFFGDFFDSIPTLSPTIPEFIITSYEYDKQNRIVEKTDSFFNSYWPYHQFDGSSSHPYTYDANGNLYANHDNKINILRTNKIWQFITTDYSLNNPVTATSYNEEGFPLVLTSARLQLGTIVPLEGMAVVEYSCH